HALRVAIDVVGDAVLADDASAVLPPRCEFVAAQPLEGFNERAPMRSRRGGRFLHFIEDARGGGVVLQQILRLRRSCLVLLVTHVAKATLLYLRIGAQSSHSQIQGE